MPRWLKITGIGCGGLFVLMIFAVVLIAALSGGGTETASEGADSGQEQGQAEEGGENTVAIGEPLTVGDTAWIVSNAEQLTELTDELGESETGNFVVVDFEFTNNSSESITLDSSMLALNDAEGNQNEPDTDKLFYIEPERDLFLEQVNPGVTKEGTVIFTVAEGSAGFILEVSGGFFSGESGFVDLGF